VSDGKNWSCNFLKLGDNKTKMKNVYLFSILILTAAATIIIFFRRSLKALAPVLTVVIEKLNLSKVLSSGIAAALRDAKLSKILPRAPTV